jgi:hypothetical protein
MRSCTPALLLIACLACSACGTTGGAVQEEPEPVLFNEPASPGVAAVPGSAEPQAAKVPEGEVPKAVAETGADASGTGEIEEVVVEAPRERHEVILDLVTQAKVLLQDVELQYVFTGKGRRETLRGRPVAFALWSESRKQWTVVHLEIPRPV